MSRLSRVRLSASCSRTPGGSLLRSSARIPAASGPSRTRTSIRDSRPVRLIHSCAWDMSVSSRVSYPDPGCCRLAMRTAAKLLPPASSVKG